MIRNRELADELYRAGILLRYNSPPPEGDRYGWLNLNGAIKPGKEIEMEGPSALYAGPYVPSIGGPGASGLCTIGAFSYSYSALHEEVKVGRYCSLSNGIRILDSTHPLDFVTTSIITFRPHNHLCEGYVDPDITRRFDFDPRPAAPYPVLEHDVWIGRDVVLGMGITIGTGAVVAASSVVTKDVPPYAVVAGNPAQIIKFRFPPRLIQRLLASGWWRYSSQLLTRLPLDKPERFLDELEREIAAGASLFQPRVVRLGPAGLRAEGPLAESRAA